MFEVCHFASGLEAQHRGAVKRSMNMKADTTKRIPAAQYLRMSTERQIYSTGYQADCIARYAAEHGFEIIKTYADEGRSGLTLRGRSALQQLLAEVISGAAEFRTILVYDVSRWGRFQDSDESAHYEFICRSASIQIHYCAEAFENDGSIASSILKHLKRVMAGEYSRELSGRVFASQSRIARSGYRAGARAPFGLRRLLLDKDGNPKAILEFGQHKFLRSDKVVLVPGPEHELSTIRLIFDMAGLQKKSDREIANELNMLKIPSPNLGCWASPTISCIIKNKVYIGTLIYNKTCQKMRGSSRANPSSEWITSEDHLKPIVKKSVFDLAQKFRNIRHRGQDKIDLINYLKNLLLREGYLTSSLINQDKSVPSASLYRHHFGSLKSAYEIIGYCGTKHRFKRSRISDNLSLVKTIIDNINSSGGIAESTDSEITWNINGLKTAIILSYRAPPFHYNTFVARAPSKIKLDLLIIKVPDCFGGYIVCPRNMVPNHGALRIGKKNLRRLAEYRLPDLDALNSRVLDIRTGIFARNQIDDHASSKAANGAPLQNPLGNTFGHNK